ncbi:tetratricopeptide repeat-containing sensor histidine kinase [Winogradskyella ursingii]|uniref:tetratricopeptide repeat-containing sensor histidine kinase n=1 Tax=Winogradskyella ursingii TaxID=2686079 RepID=UPI00293BBA07|nr:histidine kinase [Winogradskyella ursingii]
MVTCKFSHIVLLLLWFTTGSFGQQNSNFGTSQDELFTIRGEVYELSTLKPYEGVTIVLNNGRYTTTDYNGKFTVKAKIGDQLVIKHRDFETIFHTVQSDDNRLTIKVDNRDRRSAQQIKLDKNNQSFNQMIDSADVYLKKDAEKSIKFIGDALDIEITTRQSAEAHELLGDIYKYWKQYDLAISAYKISLQNAKKNSAKLKLAKAYMLNGNYQNSIVAYSKIDVESLSNYEKTQYYEGIGDAYVNSKNFVKAIDAFTNGLKVAEQHKISTKITDLNSKIAQTYSIQGKKNEAKLYFNNSLNLAKEQNVKRAVEEQIEVAEFNNRNRDYDDEIELRKRAIEGIEDIEKDSVITNESPITTQKQNYKIGSAYYLQNDFPKAIEYLEKSKEEADKKGDLVVGKDATRKLSEVLISSGETEKGIEYINEYKNIVDKIYAQKEQELSQVARFSRNIAEQQNRITSLESDRKLSLSKYQLTQERNKRQQLIIYSLIGGLLLLLVTGFLMFKYIKQQRLANNLLALKSLRSQMNPHFIFNALNSVNSFIATNDERTANKYLSDFSLLMRAVLENSEEDFIPLKQEIELLELYTKLEHFRFKDKFEYNIHIDKNVDVDSFQIPPMLLQPYIENAVWHGLRYKSEKGHLNIDIKRKSKDELIITISDDGIGRERSKALKTEHQKKQNSKGMNNIKRRVAILNNMYKDKVDVSIEDFQNLDDTGTKVIVTLKKD